MLEPWLHVKYDRCVWLWLEVHWLELKVSNVKAVRIRSLWQPCLYDVVDSGKVCSPEQTPPKGRAHSGSGSFPWAFSGMETWFFWVSGMKVLEEQGVKDVQSWNPALFPWAISLPVNKILQPAFSPVGIEGGSDSEGRLAVYICLIWRAWQRGVGCWMPGDQR